MIARWKNGLLTGLVLAATAALVILDCTCEAVRAWGEHHAFTVDTAAGVLVLLITVLVVNQVVARRQLRDRKSAIAAQSLILLGQSARAVQACRAAANGDEEDLDAARDETRSYMVMLLIAAPLLIDASPSRLFLEQAQMLGGQLARLLSRLGDGELDRGKVTAKLDAELTRLRQDAAPLIAVLSSAQRAALPGGPAPDPALNPPAPGAVPEA